MDKVFDSLSDSSDTSSAESEFTAVTIDETILYDQDGYKITAKGLTTDGYSGPQVKLLIENNSSKSIIVQCRNLSVNGYMIEPVFSADVAAGKKANDSITLMKSDLEAAKITTIADIEFCLHIIDADS